MSHWISKWYEISSKRGHCDVVPFFYIDSNSQLTDLSFRHRDMDATARFATYLNASPKEKKGSTPAFFRKFHYLLRGIFQPYRPTRPAWKNFDPQITLKHPNLSWTELSEEETKVIEEYCLKARISVSMFLMERLNKLIFKELMMENHGGGSWLFPVNMRGWVQTKQVESNCVSYIPLTVTPTTSAKELHQEMKKRLSRQEHWSNWILYHVGVIVRRKGMEYLSGKTSRNQFWLGSFSDLGDWTQEASPSLDGRFIFCPPGSPNYPVSVGMVKFRGNRTVAMKIHPSIGQEHTAGVIIEELKNQIRLLGGK